jgi:hypothetical protein
MSSTDEEAPIGDEEQEAEEVLFDEANGKDGFAIKVDAKQVCNK